jgi:hypothetical protein
MSDTTPNLPTEVTVALDFTPYLSEGTSDIDGEFRHQPITFEQIIIDRVGQVVAEKFMRDRYKDLRKDFEDRVQAIVAEKVDARITQVLDEPRQPTDGYGAVKGEPTTLNEIILSRVDAHLRIADRDQYNSRRDGKTRLQQLTNEAIDRKWDAEVRKAITEAQDAVRQEVASRAADVMTKAIKESL